MTGDPRSQRQPTAEHSTNTSNNRPPNQNDSDACNTALAWDRLPRFSKGHTDDLAAVISRDIVPALLTAFGARQGEPLGPASLDFSEQDRAEFANSVLVLPAQALSAVARQFIEMGFTVEQVLLELLAPVARQLGILWERDEIGFVEVTIAVQKIQYVLHAVCRTDHEFADTDSRPLALMVPAPQETHIFGLLTMNELLRRRGWNVVGGLPMDDAEILSLVGRSSFAMIGFSLSAEVLLKPTAAAIRRVRRKSRNKSVKIVIGGRACALCDNLAAELGADAAFADAAEACTFADAVAAQQTRARR